ncbi:MAG: hypothetical protein OEL83_14185 [Desulforhopalus sp.]|nr:hypothetical protein [Desulforhopalus sp.]
MTATVQYLKKVALLLKSGGEPQSPGLTDSPVPFEFIYGVGSGGICQFEAALCDKQVGDDLHIPVTKAKAGDFFGHLLSPLRQALGLQIMPETFTLAIEIAEVTDATDREVAQAVAKGLSHGGCGGSCGCGC